MGFRMVDYVLTGLVKRRAELAGEAATLRTRLAQIGTDLGHIDAVIRQLDPDHDLGAIRPKRPRGPDVAGRGERSRALLTVLREAGEPLSTAEVVHRMMARAGQDVGDQRLVARLMKRVGTVLAWQKRRDTVRAVREAGQLTMWEVAR
jgi:hypothetical protein